MSEYLTHIVIPAKAGIQKVYALDSGLRRNDGQEQCHTDERCMPWIPASAACLEFPLRGGGKAGIQSTPVIPAKAGIQSVGADDTPSVMNHAAGVFL